MKTVSKIVKLKCDFCGKEVDKFAEPRSVTLFFRPIEAAGIIVYGKGFGPGPGSEDVCQECFDKALVKIADALKKIN